MTQHATRQGGLKLALSLAAIGAALAGCVYLINENSVERLLTADAKAKSQATAHYFEKNLEDVTAILNGAEATPASKSFIVKAIEANNIDKFKLYSSAGHLMLDSTQLDHPQPGGDLLGSHNPEAFAALAANEPFVILEEEHSSEGDELVAETYVPIIRAGKPVGVAEVYADQTANAAMFRSAFTWTSLLIATLAALGFAFPAIAFQFRTKQKLAADENLRFLANHDALTKLPNRTSFLTSLVKGMNASLDNRQMTALHFIDLDFFKEINDRHGHAFGDEALRAISGRLQKTLRDGDIVSRFGGDEFVIAQFGFSKDEQFAAATARIVRAFKEPFRILDREIVITASIGTAVSPKDGETAEQLIKSADTAVYVVKARGRNGHCLFEPKFDAEKSKRLALETIVRNAVATNDFDLHFQPLYKFDENALKGFEALLRLRDGDGNFVSPVEFIPVAEEIGLIDEVGSWVLERACQTAAAWPDGLQISVNLSAAQFKRRSVLESTRSALAKSGLAPERLLLEITESLLLTDTEHVLEQLRDLKSLGIAIVMDDFGTGYSSLGYMLKFPFDRIKIDRSFITELASGNTDANSVVQTIITLGHTLHMNVTAEGVETPGQAAALRAMKCDDAQGYLFGRPMPATEIPALLLKAFAGKHTPADEQQDAARLQA